MEANKQKIRGFIFFLLALFFLNMETTKARGGEIGSTFEKEMLLFEEIPMVVTAFKRSQRITESPSARGDKIGRSLPNRAGNGCNDERRNNAKSRIFHNGARVHEYEFSLFAQNEYRFLDNLSFVAGVKMENNERVDEKFSPRFTILYAPVKNHVLRASVGRAYRNPTIYEGFDTINISIFPFSWFTIRSLGYRDLKPESMVAYELGYRGKIGGQTNISLELYQNEIKDLTEMIPTSYLIPSWNIFPLVIEPRNRSDARAMGIELDIRHSITPWCKVCS